MSWVSATSPVARDANLAVIDLVVTWDDGAVETYTASSADTDPIGLDLWTRAASGEFGSVSIGSGGVSEPVDTSLTAVAVDAPVGSLLVKTMTDFWSAKQTGATGLDVAAAATPASARAVLELDQYRQSPDGNAGVEIWSDNVKWRLHGAFAASSATSYGAYLSPKIPTNASTYVNVVSIPSFPTGAAISTLIHFSAIQSSPLNGAAPAIQRGFHAGSSLAGGTSNVGFQADVPAGAANWNFYAGSSAPSYFAGRVYTAGGLTVTATVEVPIGGVSAPLQVHAAGASGLGLSRWTLDTSGPVIRLAKTRGTTVGGVATAVVAGDTLAQISAHAADGSDLASEAARISVQVTAAPTTGSAPGRIVLATTPVGGSTPVERLRIDDAGNIKMGGSSTVISAERHPILRSYTVATLPTASPAAQLIYVSNGASSKRLAVSDGTAWRWPDGAVVS